MKWIVLTQSILFFYNLYYLLYKSIMKNLEKFIPSITLFFCLITLFRTCGVSTQQKKINQKLDVIENRIDSLSKITITEEKLKIKLETTIMWETLVLEELSDKQKMPINHYKNQK